MFGSIRPWYGLLTPNTQTVNLQSFDAVSRYESVAIALGASYVATVEYAPLQYDFNRNGVRIETFKPDDALLAGLKGSFDVAISISSFEHDGLGR